MRTRERLAAAWEGIFGPDPGLLRLQMAGRVVVSAAMTLAALLLLQPDTHLPIAAIALGLMVSIFAAVSVRDPTPAQQCVTIVLIPLPALAAAALGATLSRWPWAADIGFIVLVFGATLARLLGPRGMSFGMVGYISYFLGDLIHPTPAQMPDLVLAMAITEASALITRFLLIRDDPAATLRHILRHAARRIARILGEVETAAVTGAGWGRRRQDRLVRELVRLNAAALAAEQQIESLGGAPGRPAILSSGLAPLIFNLELAAERIVRVAAGAPSGTAPDLHRRIARLRAGLLRGGGRLAEELGRHSEARPGDPPLAHALDELSAAVAAMADARHAAPLAPGTEADAAAGQQGGGGSQAGFWHSPALRQAVQVAVAVGLAIGLGSLISGRRWYWAAIAAFIVCLGVGSRGEALTKALQRVIGTIAGIIVGIFVAAAVSGHTNLALGLILVCAFFAFYAFQSAYGVMVFWITNMVALLYGLLGEFRPSLLVLRLEETALGAVIGVAVSMLLLPVRTQDAFRDALLPFLGALHAAVEKAAAELADPSGEGRALAASRELDRKGQALHDSIGPLKRGWVALLPAAIRHAARAVMQCTYLARELAHVATWGGAAPAQHPPALHTRTEALLTQIDSLRDRLRSEGIRRHAAPGEDEPWEIALGGRAAALHDPLLLLDGLGRALRRLEQSLWGD